MTILIGFSAVNTGNNLVYIVTSALLSYMVVSGIFGRKNLCGMDILLEFPDEIYAKTDVPVGIKLINHRKFMPAFLIKIALQDQEILIPFVGAKSSELHRLTMRFKNRGTNIVEKIRISSVFPFSFFTRYKTLHQEHRLVVFPKPLKCRLVRQHDHRTRAKGDLSADLAGFEADLLSIRNYVPGDPLRYINWKSTAKTGQLKTKELSSVDMQYFMIDLDRMEKKDLESVVSCVTYTVLKMIRSRIPIGLCIGGETFKPNMTTAHKLRLLEKLALYGEN